MATQSLGNPPDSQHDSTMGTERQQRVAFVLALEGIYASAQPSNLRRSVKTCNVLCQWRPLVSMWGMVAILFDRYTAFEMSNRRLLALSRRDPPSIYHFQLPALLLCAACDLAAISSQRSSLHPALGRPRCLVYAGCFIYFIPLVSLLAHQSF